MNQGPRPEIFPDDRRYYDTEKTERPDGKPVIVRVESRELSSIPVWRVAVALASYPMHDEAENLRITIDGAGRIEIICRLDDGDYTLSHSFETGEWVCNGEWSVKHLPPDQAVVERVKLASEDGDEKIYIRWWDRIYNGRVGDLTDTGFVIGHEGGRIHISYPGLVGASSNVNDLPDENAWRERWGIPGRDK